MTGIVRDLLLAALVGGAVVVAYHTGRYHERYDERFPHAEAIRRGDAGWS